MRTVTFALALGLSTVLGCESKPVTPDPKPELEPEPAPDPPTTAAPDPAPLPVAAPAKPELYTPGSAVPPISIAAPGRDCPPLPRLARDTGDEAKHARKIAEVIRRLSCEPEQFAKSAEALNDALALDGDLTVSFSGPTTARIETKTWPTAKQLANALGIEKPGARLHWNAYHDQWYLASDLETGALDLFGPGEATIMISHEADRDDPMGKVVPLTDEMKLRGFVSVSMPESAATMAPDVEGLKQLAAAMRVLAADPSNLAKEPEEVAKILQLEGERFRLARTSLHSGDSKIDGISIQPMRTRIPADELANALGLKDAVARNANREHDVWKVKHGGSTDASWSGVVLEIRVDVAEKGNRETTLKGAEVEFISLRPN